MKYVNEENILRCLIWLNEMYSSLRGQLFKDINVLWLYNMLISHNGNMITYSSNKHRNQRRFRCRNRNNNFLKFACDSHNMWITFQRTDDLVLINVAEKRPSSFKCHTPFYSWFSLPLSRLYIMEAYNMAKKRNFSELKKKKKRLKNKRRRKLCCWQPEKGD